MTERGETRAERRERLRRAAGEAIRHAAETDGDPLALMMAATGEQAKYCDPVLRQHPLFFELRGRFLMPEERLRKEQEERDAAAVAAEPGLVIWVRRQFDDHRHAAYRITDMGGLHWSNRSGGVQHRANRHYLHGYVWCDGMIAGELAHPAATARGRTGSRSASPKSTTRRTGGRSSVWLHP